jgi:hypothetical protein
MLCLQLLQVNVLTGWHTFLLKLLVVSRGLQYFLCLNISFSEVGKPRVGCHLRYKTLVVNKGQLYVSIDTDAEILMHIPFSKNSVFSWYPGDNIYLGDLVYEPPRDGPTIWEIGVPDRSAAEFYVPDPNPNYVNRLFINQPAAR